MKLTGLEAISSGLFKNNSYVRFATNEEGEITHLEYLSMGKRSFKRNNLGRFKKHIAGAGKPDANCSLPASTNECAWPRCFL